MRFEYGPTFQGVAHLWQGEREALAEISIPADIREQLSDYRLHPAVLDACFHACLQSALSALPARTTWQGAKGTPYVPVKIERVSFHAVSSGGLFAYARLKEFGLAHVKADVHMVDDTGNPVADVDCMILRPLGQRAQRMHGNLYEFQWKLSPRATRGARDSRHLPSP